MVVYPPSHRDPEQPQPEVCSLTGVLVPSQDLIVSNVEGLRGAHVSGVAPFAQTARLRPSYNDLRGIQPGPPVSALQQKGLSGAGLWFRGEGGGPGEVGDTLTVPGPDGEPITILNPGTPDAEIIG